MRFAFCSQDCRSKTVLLWLLACVYVQSSQNGDNWIVCLSSERETCLASLVGSCGFWILLPKLPTICVRHRMAQKLFRKSVSVWRVGVSRCSSSWSQHRKIGRKKNVLKCLLTLSNFPTKHPTQPFEFEWMHWLSNYKQFFLSIIATSVLNVLLMLRLWIDMTTTVLSWGVELEVQAYNFAFFLEMSSSFSFSRLSTLRLFELIIWFVYIYTDFQPERWFVSLP